MKLQFTKFSPLDFALENFKDKTFFQGNTLNNLYMMSKGFHVKTIHLQNLNPRNYKEYLPDACVPRITTNSNSGYWPIFHDKYLFYNFVKNIFPTNKLLGLVLKGVISGVDNSFAFENLMQRLELGDSFVLKPLQGGNGAGILFLKSEGSQFKLQETQISQADLQHAIGKLDNYGIFEFNEQHDAFAKIYPGSINTIRLITIYDPEAESNFVFAALLRIGSEATKPFHNFTNGGVVSMIDVNTGKLTVSKMRNKRGAAADVTVHPDTGIVLNGIVVPYWEEITKTILDFLEKHPMFDFLGWDILVTNEGFLIIEANHNPGIQYLQSFRPLLSDQRAASYFKKTEIFKGF